MMKEQLSLDQGKVRQARELAHSIALQVQEDIRKHTTVTIERTVARLFGIDGTDQDGIPLANILVDQVNRAGLLDRGIAFWLGNALVALGQAPQQIAERCAGDLRIGELLSGPAQGRESWPIHRTGLTAISSSARDGKSTRSAWV